MSRELLSQQAADQLKSITPTGDSALHLAARRRDVDMVRILVDYGAQVDMQNVSSLMFPDLLLFLEFFIFYTVVSSAMHQVAFSQLKKN